MGMWRDLLKSNSMSEYGISMLKDNATPFASPASFASPVSLSPLKSDKGEMSVTCVLTTPTCDRQGDIVEPHGGNLIEHQSNPIVMFAHGRDHKLPIGKAEDKNGNYTVRLVNGSDGTPRLVAKTYFSQSSPFANDVFGLVAEDILRGISVGFDPIEDDDRRTVEVLGPSPTLERKALRFKSWKLLEYSHTPLGVNKEALTVAVHKALDGSRSMSPKLLKFLEPFASPRRATVTSGFSRVEKTMPVTDAYEEPAMSNTQDDMESDTTASPEDTQELPVPDEGAGDDLTPAVKTSYDVAQALTDMCDRVAESMKKSEHKEAKQKFAKFIAELKDMAEEWKSFGDDTKADLEGDEEVKSDGEGDGEPGEDADGESKDMEGDDATAVDDAEDEDTEAEIAPIQKDATGGIIIKGYKPVRWLASDLAKSTVVNGKKTQVVGDKNTDSSDLAKRVKSLERAMKEKDEVIKERDKELKQTLNEFKNYQNDVDAAKRAAKRR